MLAALPASPRRRPVLKCRDEGAAVSRRVQRWMDEWIEANVWPGSAAHAEEHAARARTLAERCLAAIAAANFPQREVDEEVARLPGLILAVILTPTLHGGDDLGQG